MTRRRTLYPPTLLGTLAAAVLVACAPALLAFSEKAEATFPGKNGRIAYSGNDGPDSEIYTIKPDGGGKFNVTDNSRDDSDPCYAPSGKKIAFSGFDGNDSEIYKSKKIAFTGSGRGDSEIYTINAGGGGRFNVTDNGTGDYSPSWGSR